MKESVWNAIHGVIIILGHLGKDETMGIIKRIVVVKIWEEMGGLNKWIIGDILGWENYFVGYCIVGYMTLHIC